MGIEAGGKRVLACGGVCLDVSVFAPTATVNLLSVERVTISAQPTQNAQIIDYAPTSLCYSSSSVTLNKALLGDVVKLRLVSLSVLFTMLFAVSVLAQNEAGNQASAALAPHSQSDQYLMAANNPPVLPDAPSVHFAPVLSLNAAMAASASQAPVPAARVPYFERKVIDAKFIAVTGALFGSTVADIELTQRCRESGACSLIPTSLAERRKMYPITFAADGALTLAGYYLRSHHHWWWYTPAGAMIAAHAVYSIHASEYIK